MQDSFLFVQIQTKESRVKRKIASYRPDLDERQLPFVKAQTKDCFLSSTFRCKTVSFRPDSDERQLPFVKARQKTASFHQDFDVR